MSLFVLSVCLCVGLMVAFGFWWCFRGGCGCRWICWLPIVDVCCLRVCLRLIVLIWMFLWVYVVVMGLCWYG